MFPIFTAKDFISWGKNVTAVRVKTSIVEGEASEKNSSSIISGILVPLEADELKMKEEGQRNWHWWSFTSFDCKNILDHNDIIQLNDEKPYRVIDRWLWVDQGFVLYHIVEDFGD